MVGCSGGIVAAGVRFAGAGVVGALSRGGAVGITATGEAVVGVGGVSPGTAAKAFAGADETGVGGLEAFFRRQPVAVITAKIDNKKKALIQILLPQRLPQNLAFKAQQQVGLSNAGHGDFQATPFTVVYTRPFEVRLIFL